MDAFAERLQRDRIAWEDDFLTPAECRELVEELDFALWRPSTVVSRTKGGQMTSFLSRRRTSETTTQQWFSDILQSRVGVIESAICAALAVDVSRLEQWQALRYGYRRRFEQHHDAGLFGSESAGERTTTLLLCVNTPDEGGSTWFPHLHRAVAARAGRLLAWQNLAADGKPDPAMEHAGRPVRKGRKIALTTWVRERSARSVAS